MALSYSDRMLYRDTCLMATRVPYHLKIEYIFSVEAFVHCANRAPAQ